ncbi:FeoA family protein [Vibrio gazogenes]|uniref:Iron transporter n=1 Tax=Vibrio gazogenes TaxID=687 RepID=A0A1Z2SK78_VIBGA|nr:FeoA domain-containing protein [Vibrio gazogenes]ASA57507.1 iron transporter [Vibrio gazogenes]
MRTLLSEVPVGNKATIVSHQSKGATRQRLLDLGLLPHMEIVFIRKAPLGDPIEIRVGITSVVVRKSEADLITVETHS